VKKTDTSVGGIVLKAREMHLAGATVVGRHFERQPCAAIGKQAHVLGSGVSFPAMLSRYRRLNAIPID
jgi:hypothetical protein